MMRVISIQSQVVYGHVGNSAAVFPMQAKGIEVAAVPTALLSNHPHYPTIHGRILEAELVEGLLLGVEERGLVETAQAVITGYLGSVENAVIVSQFIARAKKRNPDLIFICDPVMGDDDLGIFVHEGLIDAFRDHLVPLASVITPNQYELELLSGHKARSLTALDESVRILQQRGTGAAVVTGCVMEDSTAGTVETITCTGGVSRDTGNTTTRTSVARLPIRPCGTGDLFTALLTARLCHGMPLAEAAAGATGEIFAVLAQDLSHPSGEMRIIGFPFASSPSPQA